MSKVFCVAALVDAETIFDKFSHSNQNAAENPKRQVRSEANKLGLELSCQQEEWLDKITTFNINARYNNFKHDFCKYRRVKTMVKKSIIDTAVKYIKQVPDELDVKKAYLFGSYAKGSDKEDSDIDIALVLGNMTDFFATQMELMRIRRKVDLRIEPHPICESDFTSIDPLADEIRKTGND